MKSWRIRQKTFWDNQNIEFDQDQRIIDWLDKSKLTYIHGDDYFNDMVIATTDISKAEQAVYVINVRSNIKSIKSSLIQLINIPRICITINKFLIYTETYNEVSENYHTALFEFVQSIFTNRKIDYYFLEKDNGTYFNFASPTTQFFIT